MLKPEQVPPGLALIARKAWAEGVGPTNDDDWNAAIAAAINAWPGMTTRTGLHTDLILPLPETKKKTQPGAFDYWPAEEEGNWGDD